MKVMGALDPAGIRKGTKKGSIERKKNTKGEKVWKTKRKNMQIWQTTKAIHNHDKRIPAVHIFGGLIHQSYH